MGNIKWSPILHGVSAVAGVLGLISLVAAWIAGSTGAVAGFSQAHLFTDAQTLLLASIAFGIGVLIHQNIEK